MSRDSDVPFEEDQAQPPTPAPLISPAMQPCPKCHSQMVKGWVPQYIGQYASAARVAWYPGAPEFKQGLFHSEVLLPPKNGELVPITAYRCVRCGFLEFYARDVG